MKKSKTQKRQDLINKAKDTMAKSLNGNGGETAKLDKRSVTWLINIEKGIAVWNGTGKKDGRKQPLSGGVAFHKGQSSIYSINSLNAMDIECDHLTNTENGLLKL